MKMLIILYKIISLYETTFNLAATITGLLLITFEIAAESLSTKWSHIVKHIGLRL
jgi:hypothetical protein